MTENIYLDEEEKDLANALSDASSYSKYKPIKSRQKMFQSAAREFKKRETKMNIRIDEFELEKIKEFAENEGLKYQAFVKSVVHKYITGQLIDKRSVNLLSNT